MTALERIAARLRALSGRERLLLLLCAAAVAAFVLAKGVVFPAAADYDRARAAIPERRATLARYDAVRGGEDRVTAELAASVERLEEWEEGLLPGDDPSAAGAYLQGILKKKVVRPDTRLTSIRTLSPAKKGDYAEISVQMDLQTTTEGLAVLLAEIPRERRILRVKKYSVTSGIHSAALVNRPDSLVVSVVVSALARSGGDEKGAGGDE